MIEQVKGTNLMDGFGSIIGSDAVHEIKIESAHRIEFKKKDLTNLKK